MVPPSPPPPTATTHGGGGEASVKCVYDLMQICERLMRDTWGRVSFKLRINPLKVLPNINSSHRVAFMGHGVMRNTWLSHGLSSRARTRARTEPCSVNIPKSHAKDVDQQLTERQRFG